MVVLYLALCTEHRPTGTAPHTIPGEEGCCVKVQSSVRVPGKDNEFERGVCVCDAYSWKCRHASAVSTLPSASSSFEGTASLNSPCCKLMGSWHLTLGHTKDRLSVSMKAIKVAWEVACYKCVNGF